ncbi:MAG: hypothetical protein AB9866_20385 [Syntrophobacteraceae bacterium]
MEWHINDLSLESQFDDSQQVRAALLPLLKLRVRYQHLRENLYTSRQLCSCQVTASANLQQAITATKDRDFIRLALLWLGRSGPFWDDHRQAQDYDHFEFNGIDVTEQGLGEASRRILANIQAGTFSFPGIPTFERTPLDVQYGFTGDNLNPVTVDNHWQINQLERALRSIRVIRTWNDVREELVRQYGGITLSTTAMVRLSTIGFSKPLALKISDRLRILNRIVNETQADGSLSPTGLELLSNYFAPTVGGRTALFKPESKNNQRDFEDDLTFVDPDDPSNKIFCHWHARVEISDVRIHFEWKRPDGQKNIKVVYIGPKITKD